MATSPFLEDLGSEFSRKKFFEEFFPFRHRRSSAGSGVQVFNFPVIIYSFPPTVEVPFQIIIGGTPPSTTKAYAVGGVHTLNVNEEFLPVTNVWSSKAVLPTGRGELMSAALGTTSKLGVVCGGDNGSISISETSHYDSGLNSWTAKTAMPSGISEAAGPQAPSTASSLYIIGGFTRPSSFINSTLEYNVDGEIWSTRANVTRANRRMGAFSFFDDLHVVGGDSPTGQNDHYKYIPSTNVWSTKTDIPATSQKAGSGYNTVGYAGRSTGMYAWDNTTEVWTSTSNPPIALFTFSMFTSISKIYAVGNQSSAKTCYSLDPPSNSWATKANMITGRYDLTSYSFETLTNPLIFFKIDDQTTVDASKRFVSLQRRSEELFSIDTYGKFSGQNSAIPQLMISVDLVEAATNDTLAATSGIINNLNRIRYKIGSIMGYPGSWHSGTTTFGAFVTLTGSQHISGAKEIGTIYAGRFSDYTGSVRINDGNIHLNTGAKIYFDKEGA